MIQIIWSIKKYDPSERYLKALNKWSVILCPKCRWGVETHMIWNNIHCARCWGKCGKAIRIG